MLIAEPAEAVALEPDVRAPEVMDPAEFVRAPETLEPVELVELRVMVVAPELEPELVEDAV